MDDEPTTPPGTRPSRGDDSQAPTRRISVAGPGEAPLSEGSSLGPYGIVRLLGAGGMGAVYEAEDAESGRRVALKVLTKSRAGAAGHERFLREGRLAAQISHPHTVYIYGTQEIDGQPVITMEKMSGGTLQDRVRQDGPLPVPEAVDAILQVVEGLEAAAAAGILHRDVKPSNCFVGDDGTVKVGDFGLSISTEGSGDVQLTATGTIMGTPSYASPEQLQGRDLDLRSDIYAVGATLFYLLTGKVPFEGTNVVTLIAAILQEAPPSPRSLGPQIPPELSRLILRCLAKKPAARCSTYAELARALFPFSARAQTPARLGRRFLAWLVDSLVLLIPATLLGGFAGATGSTPGGLLTPERQVLVELAVMGIGMSYLVLLEGLWGMTLGKLAAGLRVVDRGGGRPGIPRALARVATFYAGPLVMLALRDSWILATSSSPFGAVSMGLSFGGYLWLFGIFLRARAANGYCALHDLASGTRVVHRVEYQGQELAGAPEKEVPDLGEPLGPFRLISGEKETSPGSLLRAWDPALRRFVWIRRVPPDTPPVAPPRQDVNRPGRLRWLGGQRSPEDCWDAYEHPEGSAFAELLETKQPWSRVGRWLLDLAEELSAAATDGTLPPQIGIENIWIASDGRAKLTEFPVGGGSNDAIPTSSAIGDVRQAQSFLLSVGRSALEGRVCSPEPQPQSALTPLPLGARELLSKLDSAELGTWDALLQELRGLARQREDVPRSKWFFYSLLLSIFPVIIALIQTVGVLLTAPRLSGRSLPVDKMFWLVVQMSTLVLGIVAVIAVGLALVTRGGLLFRVFGLVVVGSDGTPVSRLRTGLRSAIAWSPALAVLAGISVGILTTPGKTAPDPSLVRAVSDVGAPALGAADAPVTLTVYLNYRLPRSATLWAELGPLLDEFPGTMRILFKQIDGRGEVGHAILEARAQGKFPEMHAGLLELCEEIDQDRIFDLARVVGLDMERFEATLEGLLHDDEIDRGLEEFFAIENRRLPLLLVNGRRYIFARNQEAMRRRMAEELRWLEGGPPPMELSLGMQIGARIGDLTDRAERFWRPLGLAALILMVSGAAWLVWKGRGLQDWIAGTYVVPR